MLRGSPISTVLPVRGVDAGHGQRVGTQAPAAGAGVAAEQQHVEAAVVGADDLAVAEHRDHEVALHADHVGAEEQRAGDGRSRAAPLTPTTASRCWRWSAERLPEPPGVHEEQGPADGQRHQRQAQRRRAAGCWRRPRRRRRARSSATTSARAASTTTTRHPDPHRDPADAPVAGDELGGAGDDAGSSPSAPRRGGSARAARGRRCWAAGVTRGDGGAGGAVRSVGVRPAGAVGRHGVPLCWGKSARPVSPVPPVTTRYDAPHAATPEAGAVRPPAPSRRTPPTSGRRRRAGRRRRSAASSTAPTVSRSIRPWTRCDVEVLDVLPLPAAVGVHDQVEPVVVGVVAVVVTHDRATRS